MLTTTIDGLWVLQVLSGTEVLAPELGLRPYLPSIETAQTALRHPVAEELRCAGVIDDSGCVDHPVLEWLTVLSRRDVALLVHLQTPSADAGPERVLLARFAQWWVTLARYGSTVRVRGAGITTSEQAATLLIATEIQRLCGAMDPAQLRPATIAVSELLAATGEGDGLRAFLNARAFDSDQVAALTLAADPARSAQAWIVALQSGVCSPASTPVIEPGAVTVIDTPQGRLVSERVSRDGRAWMIVGPATTADIASAVRRMMRRLPAQQSWYSHRKATI